MHNPGHSCYHSSLYEALINQLALDPAKRNPEIYLADESAYKFMREYEYALSPWPTIIPKNLVINFNTLSQQLPVAFSLMLKDACLKNLNLLEKYLQWPKALLELIPKALAHPDEIIARYDISLSGGQAKLLEINLGASIGGWEIDCLLPAFHARMQHACNIHNGNIQYSNILEKLFNALVKTILKIKGSNVSGNILWYSLQDTNKNHSYIENHIQNVYNEIKPHHMTSGRVLFFKDFSSLHFSRDGTVTVNNQVIDAVLIPALNSVTPDDIHEKLIRSYLSRKIIFPDSPLHTILSDKMLFALMHEWRSQLPAQSGYERLIKDHIPWTARLNQNTRIWGEPNRALSHFVQKHKDRFVLKKSISAGGKDVIVGKYTPQREWDIHVLELQEADDWLAQEYCAPDPTIACAPDFELGTYEFIWGVFAAQRQYLGTYVRAVPVGACKGVINSSSGAMQLFVYEEHSDTYQPNPSTA